MLIFSKPSFIEIQGRLVSVFARAFTAFVNRHGAVALRIAADIIYAVAGAVAVGSVAVRRYIGGIRALHLSALFLGIGGGVDGRFIVREVGFFFGE